MVTGQSPKDLARTVLHECRHVRDFEHYETIALERRARLFELEFGFEIRGTTVSEVLQSLREMQRRRDQHNQQRINEIRSRYYEAMAAANPQQSFGFRPSTMIGIEHHGDYDVYRYAAGNTVTVPSEARLEKQWQRECEAGAAGVTEAEAEREWQRAKARAAGRPVTYR